MKVIGPILLAISMVALAPAQKLSVTANVKSGDSISGDQHFVVKVDSKNPVTQVEFYVGSELRGTDPSVPYEFDLDTLGESDGALKVKFVAYTNQGESAADNLTLNVDNGLGKGVDYHLAQAKGFLTLSKWDEAIRESRIAIKLDKSNVEAHVDLARAYMGQKIWDKAQVAVGDALKDDPKNADALNLSAVINLNQAFTTFSHSDDRSESIERISTALNNAVTARRKYLDEQIDGFGAVTDANRLSYADLAIKAGRYSLAIEQLNPVFRQHPKDNAVADRLIFAQMRAGRMDDAKDSLALMDKFGSPDAYGNALEALYWEQAGNDDKADEAIKNAILNDPDNLGVKSAQAFIALKRNRPNVLAQIAKDLASSDSQRSEVNYYIASLYNRLMMPQSEDYFERAVLIEPTNYDMYVEWGNYSLGLGVKGNLGATAEDSKKAAQAEVEYAKALYKAALTANPSSSQALCGLALVAMYQGKLDDAVRYGKAAAEASPQYAAAHYIYSAAASAKATSISTINGGDNAAALKTLQDQLTQTAAKENTLAGNLDQVSLQGREIPNVGQARDYFATGGRTIVMVPPSQNQ